jgi:hypothetical protein
MSSLPVIATMGSRSGNGPPVVAYCVDLSRISASRASASARTRRGRPAQCHARRRTRTGPRSPTPASRTAGCPSPIRLTLSDSLDVQISHTSTVVRRRLANGSGQPRTADGCRPRRSRCASRAPRHTQVHRITVPYADCRARSATIAVVPGGLARNSTVIAGSAYWASARSADGL